MFANRLLSSRSFVSPVMRTLSVALELANYWTFWLEGFISDLDKQILQTSPNLKENFCIRLGIRLVQ